MNEQTEQQIVAETKPQHRATITLRDVAQQVGICYETARRWAHKGRLPVFRFAGAGQWRAYPEDVDAYIEKHKNQAAAPWSSK